MIVAAPWASPVGWPADSEKCWASLASSVDLDETACNLPAADGLGLCAAHREEIARTIHRPESDCR